MVVRRTRNFPARFTPQAWVKPRKLKVSGFRFPSNRLRSRCAKRSNLIRRVLSGWSFQRESLQSLAQFLLKASSIVLIPETHNEVVGPSNDDHVATCPTPPPLLCPEVQHIME